MADGMWEREFAGTSSCFRGCRPWFWTQALRELCQLFLTYSIPHTSKNTEFHCADLFTGFPTLEEKHVPAHVLYDFCNAFPKKSLFPLLFAFPLQLAICHNGEKQQRQHTKEAQTQWQGAAEVNTALRCQSALSSPDKSSKEANNWDIFHLAFEFALGITDFSQTCIDCSLPYQRQDSSFWASLPGVRSSTITPLKQLTFPFKFLSQGKSTQPAECCIHQKGLLFFFKGYRRILKQPNTPRHSNSFVREGST